MYCCVVHQHLLRILHQVYLICCGDIENENERVPCVTIPGSGDETKRVTYKQYCEPKSTYNRADHLIYNPIERQCERMRNEWMVGERVRHCRLKNGIKLVEEVKCVAKESEKREKKKKLRWGANEYERSVRGCRRCLHRNINYGITLIQERIWAEKESNSGENRREIYVEREQLKIYTKQTTQALPLYI